MKQFTEAMALVKSILAELPDIKSKLQAFKNYLIQLMQGKQAKPETHQYILMDFGINQLNLTIKVLRIGRYTIWNRPDTVKQIDQIITGLEDYLCLLEDLMEEIKKGGTK